MSFQKEKPKMRILGMEKKRGKFQMKKLRLDYGVRWRTCRVSRTHMVVGYRLSVHGAASVAEELNSSRPDARYKIRE